MIVVTSSIQIQRRPEEVFDALSDARNESRWLPGAHDVELVTPGVIAKGTRFRGRYDRAGWVGLELVEFDRPSRVTFRARSRIVDFDDAVRLNDVNGGTLLEATMTAQPKGVMRLFAFAMRRVMAKQFTANWGHFRAYLEDRR